MFFLVSLALLSTAASFGRAEDLIQSTTTSSICKLDPLRKSVLVENWVNIDNTVSTPPSFNSDGNAIQSSKNKTKQLNVCKVNESDKSPMVSDMMYSLCQYPYICRLDDGR